MLKRNDRKVKKWKWKSLSRVRLFETPWTVQNSGHGILQAKNTAVGSCSLLQGISQPRDRTQVSHIVGRFFTSWATREVSAKLWIEFTA